MTRRKSPIPVYFTLLELENVRCFSENQELDLTSSTGSPARWTLILGDNGVGKTTLLQCLAWMRLLPAFVPEGPGDEPIPSAESVLTPALEVEQNEVFESLLRAGRYAELKLAAKLTVGGKLASDTDKAPGANGRGKIVHPSVKVDFSKRKLLNRAYSDLPKIDATFEGAFNDPLIVTYGANRQLGEQNLGTGELDDPIDSSRLSTFTELYDVEEILTTLDYASARRTKPSREHAELERLRGILAKILPGELSSDDVKIFPPDILNTGEPSGVHLKTFSGLVPMRALSLGYQSTLAWTTDLAWRLLKQYPKSTNPLGEPAVVLIDEIDLHLHPRWQLRIMDDLTSIFSNTQFVATAHSPLMVQVAEGANLVLLRKRETDVEIVNDPEVVRTWRVDQILASELFEIPRARNKETERLFARRDELVDKASRTAGEEAELQRIRTKISELPTAQDPKDQEAMNFIRQAAALLKSQKIGHR